MSESIKQEVKELDDKNLLASEYWARTNVEFAQGRVNELLSQYKTAAKDLEEVKAEQKALLVEISKRKLSALPEFMLIR